MSARRCEEEQTTWSALVRELGAWRVWALAVPPAALTEALGLGAQDVLCPLTEPPVSCADVRAWAASQGGVGHPAVVDLSLCGPRGCGALRLGAHLVVAALDEAGVLVAAARSAQEALPEACARLDALAASNGADEGAVARALDARTAWWRAASDAAQVVASYLRCHPCVAELRYPGLKGDASFEVAARTLQGGFGPYVDFRVAGEGGWRHVSCTDTDPLPQVLRLEAALAPQQGS